MKIKELVSKLAKAEGKKHQMKVGDVREIVGLISDEMVKDSDTLLNLVENGHRRAKRNKK